MTQVVPSDSTKSGLETATADYQQQLPGSPGESLLLERGLKQQTIQSFRLGYVGSPISGHERFRGYITIPYLTISGVVSIRFRRVVGEDKKYLSVHGDPGRPYNVGSLFEVGPIFVTEGEMDAIVGSQCGLLTVGFPGANAWQPVFSRLFRFRKVFVLTDGDQPGREFGDKVCRDIQGAQVIEMEPGGDVNSMYLGYGEQYLREWVGLDG